MKSNRQIEYTQSPKVSVVMPFHVRNDFLTAAIASVQNYSGRDVEILCVADGLPKSEVESLRNLFLDDPRVQVLGNSGKGLVDALNTGIIAAKAPLIARMDSDDLFVPNRLEYQQQYLDSHPNVSVIGGQLTYICEHSIDLGTSRYPKRYRSFLGMKPNLPQIAHPSAMFRKSLWERVGKYRSNFPHVEDLDFWNRCLDEGPIHNSKAVLLRYRIHPNQVSNTQAETQRIQAGRADLFALLGYVPTELDKAPPSLDVYLQIIENHKTLPIGKRLKLKHILGFFATRAVLAEIGKTGGFLRGSKATFRLAIDCLWAFPISSAYLGLKIILDRFGQDAVDWSACTKCAKERRT